MRNSIAVTLASKYTRRFDVSRPGLASLAADGLLIVSGSLFVALLAQLSIPLFPVPVTGQTLGVLLAGAALGSRRGAASLGLYLAEGAAGFPFFAGGASGPAAIIGPTGGYLVGFVAAAYVIGLLCERGLDRSWKTALLPFLAGQAVIFAAGLLWLGQFTGWDGVLAGGFYPFIPGMLIKTALAAVLLPSAWKTVRSLDQT